MKVMLEAEVVVKVMLNKMVKLLLVQRPITLVFIMINSYNYSTNDLVFIKFQIFIKMLVGT